MSVKRVAVFALFLQFSGAFAQPGRPAPEPGQSISREEIQRRVTGDGLTGIIHGAVPSRDFFIFTYAERSTTQSHGFSVRTELALTTTRDRIREQLRGLHRNEQVTIKGSLLDNRAPVPHIDVSEVTVLRSYQRDPRAQQEVASPAILNALPEQGSFVAIVHFVSRAAAFLVVDYRDHVVPIIVPTSARNETFDRLYASLNRFDRVRIHYRKIPRQGEHQPLHVRLARTEGSPIEVEEAVTSIHQTQTTARGWLVQYPINPAIGTSSVTYGIRIEGAHQTTRDYFFNNNDAEKRRVLVAELDRRWRASLERGEWQRSRERVGRRRWRWVDSEVLVSDWSQVFFSRNRYINRGVPIEAQGTVNVVAPNQANPQLLTEVSNLCDGDSGSHGEIRNGNKVYE